MSHLSNKLIEAVVIIEEGSSDELAKPFWKVLSADSYFRNIRLYSEISFEEIGLIMFEACKPIGEESINQNAKDALNEFVANQEFGLAGGLIFKENGEVKFGPSCCCDLEDWSQWMNVPNGNKDIWNGHDPYCKVEVDAGKIKVWQDEELKNENPSIEFSVEEFVEKIAEVKKDLKDFLVRLSQWTKQIEPSLEKQVVQCFAQNIHIEI